MLRITAVCDWCGREEKDRALPAGWVIPELRGLEDTGDVRYRFADLPRACPSCAEKARQAFEAENGAEAGDSWCIQFRVSS